MSSAWREGKTYPQQSKLSSLNLSDIFVHFLFHRVRCMVGNIEDIRDYHKKVMLPRMEKAAENAQLMRQILWRKN